MAAKAESLAVMAARFKLRSVETGGFYSLSEAETLSLDAYRLG